MRFQRASRPVATYAEEIESALYPQFFKFSKTESINEFLVSYKNIWFANSIGKKLIFVMCAGINTFEAVSAGSAAIETDPKQQ